MGMSAYREERIIARLEFGPQRESYEAAEERLVSWAHQKYVSEDPGDVRFDLEWLERRLAVILNPETGYVEADRHTFEYR